MATAFDESIREKLNNFPFIDAVISTMTIMITLSLNLLDIEAIVNNKNKDYIPNNYYIRVPGEKKNKKKNFRSFKNSISIIFESLTRRKVCVKVFRNGKLQITGESSISNTIEIANTFCRLYSSVTDSKVHVLRHDIHMFNIIFNLKKSLNLSQLYIDLKNKGYQAIYNRDIYSGIKIKKPMTDRHKPLTVLGFSSGNFILAGLKKPEDIDALNPITSFLAQI
jgi:TATA-box binding protein (TBP) (component of TFIID and TFIIIB)